ncbi:MAG: DEAD/DEAH box helicase [candidate division KSB1 bacterium]|nr:DEAD/DEAH box helicase [candidate division KSB1 bacterium]
MPDSVFKSVGFHTAVETWFRQVFDEPSPPQVRGWPQIAAGRHTLILSPTGSGKTLAAFLWAIDDLLRTGLDCDAKVFDRNAGGFHTLYISPLKALNNDIYRNLKQPLRGISGVLRETDVKPPHIRAAVRTGDTPSSERQSMLRRPPHILNTTPESLYLLLTSERVRPLFQNLKYVILDEIHSICSNKRGVHLSLSLERLTALCETEPVRIGLSATQRPLQRIADYLGGQTPGMPQEPRPVQIVDCGRSRFLDIRVESPVADFGQLPDATVWPAVINRLYDLIRTQRTTLVFINMRAQTEKIARQLNERYRGETGDPEAVLALAHHGSISREMRYRIEDELKRGLIPAVIATASLEMGIDIGSIDLVVHLNSPASVTSMLQRIGRSGHQLQAVSRGLVLPLYKADLDDAVALTRAALNADIEEAQIPENALDVLAQQMVAELSMRSMTRIKLYQLIRASYCYRNLSENAFNQVVRMLTGRYESTQLRALKPRLTWDRVNDQLIARRGARLTAVMNGGTIADRGYYGVYLQGTRTRLGEVEEEFVFESRVGDIFFLGNTEWCIADIERDRIFVTARASSKPRAPFWKAEPLFRDFHTSLLIGALRRGLEAGLDTGNWPDDCPADEQARANTLDLLRRQKAHTGELPTDQRIVAELFTDSVNEPHLVLHAPFGGRVLGAWATALGHLLEQRYGSQIQFTFDDDAVLIRLPDVTDFSVLDELLQMRPDDAERLLTEALPNTPLFAVRFRHNASRALLLQRSRVDQRIPLWLQRLRAADLLQAVTEFSDFPILLETLRDCLQNVFDSEGLKTVLQKIQAGSMRIHKVETRSPSPMASGVMFRLVFNYMYDYDQSRIPGQAAEFHRELLDEILGRNTIPTLVSSSVVRKAEQVWQYTLPERRAKDREDLFEILSVLGPISERELSERAGDEWRHWLQDLQDSGRIQMWNGEWITAEDRERFWQDEDGYYRLQRILKTRGPAEIEELEKHLPQSREQIYEQLETLLNENRLVRGQLVVGAPGEQWCDRENFAQLYRRAIAVQRRAHEPLQRTDFYRFLLDWHHLEQHTGLTELVRQYSGYNLPLFEYERCILIPRLSAGEFETDLINRIADGEVIPLCSSTSRRIQIMFLPRSCGSVLLERGKLDDKLADSSAVAQQIAKFLRDNGASPHHDIAAATELTPVQVDDGLGELSRTGLVSCDDYRSFMNTLQQRGKSKELESDWHRQIRPAWRSAERHHRGQRSFRRQAVKQRLVTRSGRWFLTGSFAVMGKELTEEERIEQQTRLLLQRYGVLVKEFYRKETGLEPWSRIFQTLKRMEWRGEIRRGYFIQGLSGVQFALPEALERLKALQMQGEHAESVHLLSTMDPALPFGGLYEWDLLTLDSQPVSVTRSVANHLLFVDAKPVFYAEQYGERLALLHDFRSEHRNRLAAAFHIFLQLPALWRPRKQICIRMIDGIDAARHELQSAFREAGYESDGASLTLWPSQV